MLDTELPTWWNFLELAGIWAAAGATFYAARTALRVALRAQSVQLRVGIEPGLIGQPSKTKMSPVVRYEVRNIGLIPATVTSFTIRSRFFRGKINYLPHHPTVGSQLPCRVEAMDQKSFFANPWDDPEVYFRKVTKDLYEMTHWWPKWMVIRSIRVGCETGSGEVFLNKPSKLFLEKVKEYTYENRN